jgi:hypothetical protein
MNPSYTATRHFLTKIDYVPLAQSEYVFFFLFKVTLEVQMLECMLKPPRNTDFFNVDRASSGGGHVLYQPDLVSCQGEDIHCVYAVIHSLQICTQLGLL